MATSVKKQAAKIAGKAIMKADEQAKESVKEKSEFLKRLEGSNLARETEGRDAFTNLRRLRGEKLPQGDEVIIARHLYEELPVLKRHLHSKGMGIGEFCSRFGMGDASESSKELHRLTLPPSKNPADVRLRRAAGKYRLLIEAISKITNESVSSLADRVLRGTSLHPEKHIGSLTEAEKLQTALQRITDKIDCEFGLYAKFMDIAQLKVKHIAAGGTEYWPMSELLSLEELSETDYKQEFADATDVRFAFWRREAQYASFNSMPNGFPNVVLYNYVLQDCSFFYVPHAPLGVIEFANLADRKHSVAEYEQSVKDNLKRWRDFIPDFGTTAVANESSISDDWDQEKLCPVGQLDFTNGSSRGTVFAWLIIYPTQDGSRLMPMLYIAYEEGGPYILPLDARNLEIFRDAIWLSETEHMSVFDRIKDLLGYRPGTSRVIEEGLRRTAPWLAHNPFFKMKQRQTDDLNMLDAFCQQLWEEK